MERMAARENRHDENDWQRRLGNALQTANYSRVKELLKEGKYFDYALPYNIFQNPMVQEMVDELYN